MAIPVFNREILRVPLENQRKREKEIERERNQANQVFNDNKEIIFDSYIEPLHWSILFIFF